MATVTRTITINAAFLQEIKEDAQHLRQLLQRVATLLRGPHPQRKTLVETLGELRDQLALHFALEEAYGYFEDAISTEPRLSRRAGRLRDEHRPLFCDLCEIEEQSEQLLYHETPPRVVRQIAAAFQTFQQRFLDHEAEENDLILQACADDLGGGD